MAAHKGVELTSWGVGRCVRVLGATPSKGGVLGRFKVVITLIYRITLHCDSSQPCLVITF